MTKNLLTLAEVQNAKPANKDYLLGDGDGLHLRVAQNGTKTWLYIYSLRGNRRKYTIGRFPTISLADARKTAGEARGYIASGIHPLDAKRTAEAETKAKELAAQFGKAPRTVNELFAKWAEDFLANSHSDKGDYVKSLYARHAAPLLGELQLKDLRTRHVVKVLDDARAKGVTRTCGMLLSNLRQLFVYGVQREWIQGDPTVGLKAANWDGNAVEEERHFDDVELHEFAKVLRESTLPLQWKYAIKLILATGNRGGETLNAPMENINLTTATWLIPTNLQKKTNRKQPPLPHLVDLSPFAVAQITGLIELYRKKAEKKKVEFVMPSHLFPSGGVNHGHADEKTLTKVVYARQLDEPLKGKTPDYEDLKVSGGQWSPQDLRRSTATLMGELGIASDVIDRCQNRVQTNKIKRTQQHQELRMEMKHAWLTVGEKLSEIFKD